MTNPNDKVDCGGDTLARTGLTKREYFAAAALQGLFSMPGDIHGKKGKSPKSIAELAVITADCLIEALNR